MRLYLEPPPFKHVQWINDRAAPRFDLAWSNIKPDWSGYIEDVNGNGLVCASDPTGDRELVDHLSREYAVDPSRVLLTNGCSEANFLAFMSTLKKGSKVLVEKPIYTPLMEIPRSMGCDVHTIKRRSPEYHFDIDEFEKKVENVKPDLVVLQNLSNPAGKMIPDHQLSDIGNILSGNNIPVLVDEVYRDFAISFDEEGSHHAVSSMVEIYDKGIITSSVTKVYGAGGLVTGWMIGPKRIVNRARRIKIYTVPMVSHWGNRTALAILKNREKVLPKEFDAIRRKSNLVSTWAKGRGDVSWSEPDGCAVGFLSYQEELPSIEACERLYNEQEVRVIPGAFFHLEKGFRISLAPPYDLLKEALTRIDDFLDRL